jgi:hypothetical protein
MPVYWPLHSKNKSDYRSILQSMGIETSYSGRHLERSLVKPITNNMGFTKSRFGAENWRPQRDSNPRRRRERPVSWARLDDGDFQFQTKKKK